MEQLLQREDECDREWLRTLLTVRPPGLGLSEDFRARLAALLHEELLDRGGPVDATQLAAAARIGDTRICVWRGDSTRLAAGAVVNAANEEGLGCFQPDHRCIDNVIHARACLALAVEVEHNSARVGGVGTGCTQAHSTSSHVR